MLSLGKELAAMATLCTREEAEDARDLHATHNLRSAMALILSDEEWPGAAAWQARVDKEGAVGSWHTVPVRLANGQAAFRKVCVLPLGSTLPTMPGVPIRGPQDPLASEGADDTAVVRVVAWRDLVEGAQWRRLAGNPSSNIMQGLPHEGITKVDRRWGEQKNDEGDTVAIVGHVTVRRDALAAFLVAGGREGVFLRLVYDHRDPGEPDVGWVKRMHNEPLDTYYRRALAAAGSHGLARRSGGGSCFGVIGEGRGSNRGTWRVRRTPS
eukprot:8357595-Alexandrium_andersonii.AAC.1